eukprot:CAMPEP_0119050530 /NCGR_PEP_ID=MMETSP1177-20130426/70467_1 /TAXON_ID=2985 /ORGANISM="Ochromonas sp, Strain CCMP1899" /LENGTH=461 /DNA_ID=CAMNT_0007029049 /DNA_START=366 /DNA_END=1751 /DNA_ORIENTATION=+
MISVLQNSIVNIDVPAVTTNIATISTEPLAITPLLTAVSTEVSTMLIPSLETSPIYALAQTPSVITSITTPIALLIQTPVDSLSSILLTAKTIDINAIFTKAFTTGKAGASAAGIQVITLMWLRTALNYQYRYGTGTMEALNTLWKEGGIKRLYQGLPFALIQGPLSRFGDTASNALVITLLEVLDPSGTIPVFLRTGVASTGAALWRIFLLPVDTVKTCLQVNGEVGLEILKKRLETDGPKTLFSGALASSSATLVGHYPWFLTYNYLSDRLPSGIEIIQNIHVLTSDLGASVQGMTGGDLDLLAFLPIFAHYRVDLSEGASVVSHLLTNTNIDPTFFNLLRSAFIGLCASSLSDICSNSLRVLKTTKQTAGDENLVNKTAMKNEVESEVSEIENNVTSPQIIESVSMKSKSYRELAADIIAKDGWGGLFGRGLQTRILANALQGMLFSVLFKYFQGSSK